MVGVARPRYTERDRKYNTLGSLGQGALSEEHPRALRTLSKTGLDTGKRRLVLAKTYRQSRSRAAYEHSKQHEETSYQAAEKCVCFWSAQSITQVLRRGRRHRKLKTLQLNKKVNIPYTE